MSKYLKIWESLKREETLPQNLMYAFCHVMVREYGVCLFACFLHVLLRNRANSSGMKAYPEVSP